MQLQITARKMLPLVLAAGLFAGSAQADHQDGQWYMTPMFSFIDDDEDRGVDDQFGGGQLGFGRRINHNWMTELYGFAANLDDQYIGNDQQVRGLGFDFIREFKLNDTFAPYGLIGAGYQWNDPTIGQGNSDFFGSLGLGLFTYFNDRGLALRTEARLRADPADNGLDDWYMSAGLRVPLGKVAPPPPPDSDGDGVTDNNDRCPGTAAGLRVGPDGCELDSDGDGVVDSKDQCPNTPRGTEVDMKGCPLADSDGDGVPDVRDACPDTPSGARVDAKGCEIDNDGDGVVNSKDRCPNTRAGAKIDVYGCEITDTIELPGVRFETNSATLVDESTRVLTDAAETLKRNPDITVEVAGHTDSVGAAAYNQGLSQRRAESVARFLTDRGVASGRMSTRGYGEADPVADNSTKEGRAANRRVELRITGGN